MTKEEQSAGAASAAAVVEEDAGALQPPADADADDAAATTAMDFASEILRDLVVLPPRQQSKSGNISSSNSSRASKGGAVVDAEPTDASPSNSSRSDGGLEHAIALPPIRAEEPVQSIKAALAEVVGLAQITNYRLELEVPAGLDDHERRSKVVKRVPYVAPLISPYVGAHAVVVQPIATKALDEKYALRVAHAAADRTTSSTAAVVVIDDDHPNEEKEAHLDDDDDDDDEARSQLLVLDEWSDLTPLLAVGLCDGAAFRMVLQRYDAAAIKDHVLRLRSLLNGNAPAVMALQDDDEAAEEGAATGEGDAATTTTASTPNKHENGNRDAGADKHTEAAENAAASASPNSKDTAARESEKEKEKEMPPLPEYLEAIDGTNLHDFFYLACGEDPKVYHDPPDGILSKVKTTGSSSSSSNKKKNKKRNGEEGGTVGAALMLEQEMREKLPRWNELDEMCRLDDCRIDWSGFHPPPSNRKWMGDLAYLEFAIDGEETKIHVTATRMGFYVNRSDTKAGKRFFDPSPAAEPCFAHSLLDCLLQASATFREKWAKALEASKERADLLNKLNQSSSYLSLFRVAVRGDFEGFATPAAAATAAQALDATLHTPSWVVPYPRCGKGTSGGDDETAWTRNQFHSYLPIRAEEDLSNSFGVDLRTGGIRDWNEELQLAREMPTTSQLERLERARLLYKIMMEFGEAALLGVKAITEGHVTPMNPNESMRTQVYLHNNIFFSRAVDAGPETFKLTKGDRAARKSANRDLQCNSTFHRMEKLGLSTLATVLIDYLGTRFVCQSILPGILIGERAHKLLIGAVESGVPLKWDEDLHKHLEEKFGESMMVASRPVLKNPLTEERVEEINRIKKESPPIPGMEEPAKEDPAALDPKASMVTCIPIEAKGIQGSDQRRYLLDFGRLTPRDANWLPQEKGGTGKWEALKKENGKSNGAVPASLEDDEWTMCVLRPELVTRFTQHTMSKFLREKREKENEKKKAEEESEEKTEQEPTGDASAGEKEKVEEEQGEKEKVKEEQDEAEKEEENEVDNKLSEDSLVYLKSLRLNVNVFLPDVKSFEGIDEKSAKIWKDDEQRVRDASAFLWDDTLPKITRAVKDGAVHQIPNDGRTLTEFLHRNGVNCRYLGRLAVLAQEQEQRDEKTEDDLKHSRLTVLERRTMPKCWLELLECEMVARAAKHVLDAYLVEHGGVAASQPAQTIASFLSALVSESEETAAQTETRLSKRAPTEPDDDDFGGLTMTDTGGAGDAVLPPIRTRYEIWQDIENEVGRRFRYTLTLFNNANKSGRARHLPLLRRICQRTGVRLVAKNYDVGSRCLTSGGNSSGGKLTGSYPISPLDIVDIVPLMKHAAAHNEGFYPCLLYPSISLPPLQVSLLDARSALERAHIQTSGRALNRGLELAQEALSMYQRVTETAAHPAVIETMELMATIFLEGGDLTLATSHGEKALGLAIQCGGFDAPNVVNAHLSLFQMLFSSRELDRSIKHLRAAIYLLELMGGPNHSEVFSAYHKLGSAYSHTEYDGKYLSSALKCFKEAGARDACDRLMDGITSKNYAKVLAGMGKYKEALDHEKKAFLTLSMFLGRDHQWTKDSDEELKKYTQLAVEKGNKAVESDKMQEEAAKADAVAADLVAEEEAASAKAKKNNKKKKTKK